jgi:putative transposase
MTPYPEEEWMTQMARNATMEGWGFLTTCRYLLHDRDSKFCPSFRQLIESGGVKTLRLPARSPNLNSYAERWVRSVKEECLAKLILFGEQSLQRALQQYLVHYHEERNHQGKENELLFPSQAQGANRVQGAVRCQERLGGLLKYYYEEAA